MNNVAHNLKELSHSIEKVAQYYGRPKPQLIAVSKRQSDERIQQALDIGHRVFGENRVQEAYGHWEKHKETYPDLELHCLGPLQSNKVEDAVQLFDVIHTVGREKIARAISKHNQELDKSIQCFIQLNTGDEEQKSGIPVQQAQEFYEFCTKELSLNIVGLMCIPPILDSASFHFALIQKKARELGLEQLSMGMSNDYKQAIAFGATHIRCGTVVFGARST